MKLGCTIKFVRQAHGLSQIEAAKELGVSNVHLSNLEHDKAHPSQEFISRAAIVWGVDLYVLAWCLHGDPAKLPPRVRDAATKLTAAFRRQLASQGVKVDRQEHDRDQKSEQTR